jgi:hypothetical protein
MKHLPLALGLATSLGLALPALAGPPPAGSDAALRLAQAGEENPDRSWKKKSKKRKMRREKVQRKMQTFVVLELSSALDLDEKRALKLATAVKEVGEERQKAHQKLRADMKALRGLLEEEASDGKIKKQLDRVLEGRKAAQKQDELLLVKTRSFLSVKEQAKLALAMPKVMSQMRRMAGKAADKRGQGERRRARGGQDSDPDAR